MLKKYIREHRNDSIELLAELIRNESMDLHECKAQDVVYRLMKELGLELDKFNTDADHLKHLDDYCPNENEFHADAYNLIGYTPYVEGYKSLMIFAHIDTEVDDEINYHIDDEKIYGLGASDDKGGIATMLLALKYYKEYYGALPYNVAIMSVLGKRGGVGGTLIACDRLKYKYDAAIYLHPAETGLGLNEIKNISLGVIDFNLSVSGVLPKPHYDLDAGISANHKMILLANQLVDLSIDRLKRYGNKDEYGTKLNIGEIKGGFYIGSVASSANFKFRLHFGKGETIDMVEKEVITALDKAVDKYPTYFKDSTYQLNRGVYRASFAMMEQNHEIIQTLENNIKDVCKINNFIYQAHGASDIRLPMILKDIPTVGIGSLCFLPTVEKKSSEWLSIDEYLNGIEVIACTIKDWIIKK